MKKQNNLLMIIGLFLNLMFLFFVPLTETNFTGITQNYPVLVFLWSFISTGIILTTLVQCAVLLPFHLPKVKLWSLRIFGFLIMTMLCPYDLRLSGFLSAIHLIFAYLFFFTISGLFLFLLTQMQFYYPVHYYRIRNFYLILSLLCGLIFMVSMSINGLFEVIYTLNLIFSSHFLLRVLIKESLHHEKSGN